MKETAKGEETPEGQEIGGAQLRLETPKAKNRPTKEDKKQQKNYYLSRHIEFTV